MNPTNYSWLGGIRVWRGQAGSPSSLHAIRPVSKSYGFSDFIINTWSTAMSTGILAAVEVNPATPSHAQLSVCLSSDLPTALMRQCGSSREPTRSRIYGACHPMAATGVTIPILKGLPGPTPISNRAHMARPFRSPKPRDQHHKPPDLPRNPTGTSTVVLSRGPRPREAPRWDAPSDTKTVLR